jgi:hypothetical protein
VVLADLNVDALADDGEHERALELLSSTELGDPVDLFEAFLDQAERPGDASRRHGPTLHCLDGLDPCDEPWPDDPARQPQRIDYQLLYPAGHDFEVTRFRALDLDDDGCATGYLSDHKALVVDLELRFGSAEAEEPEASDAASDDPPPAKDDESSGGTGSGEGDGADYWGRAGSDDPDGDEADEVEPMVTGGGCHLGDAPNADPLLLTLLLVLLSRRGWRGRPGSRTPGRSAETG